MPADRPRRSQAERSRATRTALLEAGRRLFAERGYATVSAEELVAAAGVSRGALYHHFQDKQDLFRAVFEQLETEIVAHLAELVQVTGDLGADIDRAVSAYLDLCERDDVRRLALIDAPAVLGWREWRETEARHGLGLLVARLELAAADGATLPAPAPVVAALLLATATEAGLLLAAGDATARTAVLAELEQTLRAMARGLFSH